MYVGLRDDFPAGDLDAAAPPAAPPAAQRSQQ